jgi:hypothetical protein
MTAIVGPWTLLRKCLKTVLGNHWNYLDPNNTVIIVGFLK